MVIETLMIVSMYQYIWATISIIFTPMLLDNENQLKELLEAGVITPEIADRIRKYNSEKQGSTSGQLPVIFGIIGAVLIGLGIILILAHNWYAIPQMLKVILAFLPMLAGQILCGYTLVRRPESRTWRESSAAFLFVAFGTCISLVSQIYNLPEALRDILLGWMLLGLPLVYILTSSAVSLMYIAGITWYACEVGYFDYPNETPWLYFPLLVLIIPHYIQILRHRASEALTALHHWLLPLSATIALGTIHGSEGIWMFVAYLSLFGVLYHTGSLPVFQPGGLRNGFKFIGSAGSVIILLIISFEWFWQDVDEFGGPFSSLIDSMQFICAILLTLASGALFILHKTRRQMDWLDPYAAVAFLFPILLLIGYCINWKHSMALTNLVILSVGILTIREGERENHLGILNFGLLIIAALVLCRYFDARMSFIVTGILFILIGAGFFVANARLLHKRKEYEKK